MKVVRFLLILIAIHSIALRAEMLSETKKVLDFFDQSIEKTFPASSDEYKKHEALKHSLRLNIVIDELRVSFSVLHYKLNASATSAKDVLLQNLQQSMSQVLHEHVSQELSTALMEFSTVIIHGVSMSDYLHPFESMEVRDLKVKITSLLEQILNIFLNSQDLHDFYRSIGMDASFSEIVAFLQSILSEK
ncbi:hypothetical protein [Endozoicomonas sp. ONNA1]|nr:hypothetical protein [Endozoicomonas sp. ONNA1]